MGTPQITNIKEALINKQFPTVLMWNRLEGRPRRHDFDRALKAEVRDALWMITKQWQMGEFKADDAGTPVFAKIHIASSKLNRYKAADKEEQNFEEDIPLEVKVEQKKIPFVRNGKSISLDIRLLMGRYWLKLMKNKGLMYSIPFIEKYKFELPVNDRTSDYIYAHKEMWQQYAAISGRCLDGYQLYLHIIAGHNAADDIVGVGPDETNLNDLGLQFVEWFAGMYYQPDEETNNAWLPDRLEYKFECSANDSVKNKMLKAHEYYHGHLDWYALDIEEKVNDSVEQPENIFTDTNTFIPAHVEFNGMPNTRWWKFEDAKTNLGDVKPSTTDLSKLLLMEFGLVYANDWFVVPYTLPIGSLSTIEGLTVKNNFGETTWIKAAEESGKAGNVWSMFKLHSPEQNNTLFLAPSAMKVHESKPFEEIVLIRDEISNMVWGIETVVPFANGEGNKGGETALQVRQYHEKYVSLFNQTKNESLFYLDHLNNLVVLNATLVAVKTEIENIIAVLETSNPDVFTLTEELNIAKAILKTEGQLIAYVESESDNDFKAKISYLAMTDVPENWIPFVPVHIKNDNREIQLQRASMLRIIEGDRYSPVKIKPLTSILREGLEDTPMASPYTIYEGEVPRAGVRISQSFQRTRWVNGEVYVWLGMKKKTGRGKGSSGLAFDQIFNIKTDLY